jgi:hypothetical protein
MSKSQASSTLFCRVDDSIHTEKTTSTVQPAMAGRDFFLNIYFLW